MAAQRKSGKALEARQSARARAAERVARAENLEKLAATYFSHLDGADDARARAEIAAQREIDKGEKQAAGSLAKADDVARDMLATGEPVAGVAELLGLSAAAVRRLGKAGERPVDDQRDERGGEAGKPADAGDGEAAAGDANDAVPAA
ncbi:hypothetical protein [Tersicoccus sp. Bi-70]|uniref:hypothetical protein n=1 Tax=Tersicoccus sp. Bi-70 TaxID=1897634 RepID=UPI0009756F3B|nr:hypothetical protein [Tersicoccus sp. Bi-70]OMH32573.1 hypothetical protein BGP79_07145 [Tersicoccus sp. Bi-70]